MTVRVLDSRFSAQLRRPPASVDEVVLKSLDGRQEALGDAFAAMLQIADAGVQHGQGEPQTRLAMRKTRAGEAVAEGRGGREAHPTPPAELDAPGELPYGRSQNSGTALQVDALPGPPRLGGADVNAIFRWCGFGFSWAPGGERARQDQHGHEGLLSESRTRI
jgi:hypothetical protein